MIQIGTDIVSIKRVEKFINKFMSANEIKNTTSINSIAGIWATKEAVSKALKCGIGAEFSFNDVEIVKDNKNAPYLKFDQKIIDKFHIQDCDVSISHDMDFAIAVVVITR